MKYYTAKRVFHDQVDRNSSALSGKQEATFTMHEKLQTRPVTKTRKWLKLHVYQLKKGLLVKFAAHQDQMRPAWPVARIERKLGAFFIVFFLLIYRANEL